MRSCILVAVLTAMTLIFSQCSKSGFESDMEKEELQLPQSVEQLGRTVAEELHSTVINLHKMGVDYSDADASEAFYNRFKEDYKSASAWSSMTEADKEMISVFSSPELFLQGFRNLTKIQLKYIDRIVAETARSASYDDMCSILLDIGSDIRENVPEIQQERLLNVVSALYYCGRELQYLEEQGLMPRTPSDVLNSIKTRSEIDSGGCRHLLLSAYALAALEPSLVGEVIVSVIAVSAILYDVIVCKKTSFNETNTNACIDRYVQCQQKGLRLCDDCLHYCVTQGDWPYWRCNI